VWVELRCGPAKASLSKLEQHKLLYQNRKIEQQLKCHRGTTRIAKNKIKTQSESKGKGGSAVVQWCQAIPGQPIG
jgi:hypothetical protein